MLVAFLEETEKLETDKKSNVSSDADVFFFLAKSLKLWGSKAHPSFMVYYPRTGQVVP